MNIKKKAERKYVGIAKIGYNPATRQPICCKYRFNDINKFLLFLQRKFPAVCWCNIYFRTGAEKNKLAYTWGKFKGLQQV
jgi:hypothetical protein